MAEEIIDIDEWKALTKAKANEFGFSLSDLEASKVAGYFTSLNLEMFKNATLLNTIGIRERFISTAKKDDSIIKAAADRNMEVDRAIPSYAKLLVLFSVADIKADNEENETDEYILSKDNPIVIDGKPFSLYYDVSIKIINNGLTDAYIVKYVQGEDGYVNPLDVDDVYTKPISVVKTVMDDVATITSDNNVAIGLVLDVRQYVREYSQCRYVQNIDTEIHKATFTNQLAEFTLQYADTEYIADSQKRYLKKENSFVMEDSPDETIYYKMGGTGEILLFNRLVGNFKPATNSILNVCCLSTLGKAGNFTYSGKNMAMNLPDTIRNQVVIITQPTGGKDAPTISELRTNVRSFISTRGTITNEEDLKKYYTDNLGSYKVSKLRHDFRNLTFSLVAGLKSERQNMYYPTNTLDLLYYVDPEDTIEQDKYIVLETKQLISYEYGLATNMRLTEADVLQYLFTVPYNLIYNQKTNTVSIYDKVFERTYPVNRLSALTEADYNIIMNRFKIIKYADMTPSITAYITTTRDIDSDTPILGFLNSDGVFVDDKSLIVRVVVKNQGIFVGYADAMITDFNETDKYYSIDISNFCKAYPYGNNIMMYLKDKAGEDMEALVPINNIFIEFEMYVKADDGVYRSHGYSDLYDYYKLSTYKSDEIELFKNLSFINNIFVTTKDDCLLFKNIPMIGYDAYAYDSINISKRLQYEIDRIETYYNLTPQNHQLTLRFANSYGFGYRYKIGYTTKMELDQIALSLNFAIKLKTGKVLEKATLITFINDIIMGIDFQNGDFLHISNIIDALKDKFAEYISFIEFNGINELPAVYQYIGLDLTQENVDATIPEILNVHNIYDESEDVYVPEIYIDFL